MHRAAPAGAGAGRLAVEFRHHRTELHALGDGVTMAAMCRCDQVAWQQRRAGAGRHRFFADIGMGEARHLAGEIVGENSFLEHPDPHHGAVHLDEPVLRGDRGFVRLALAFGVGAHVHFLSAFDLVAPLRRQSPQSIGYL